MDLLRDIVFLEFEVDVGVEYLVPHEESVYVLLLDR